MAELVNDSSPEDADPDLHIAARDFSKLEDKHIKAGFREGAATGKEATLQIGFSDGFSGGVGYAVHWGMLKGKISALQAYCTSSSIPTASQLSDLLKEVEKLEEDGRRAAFADQLEHYKHSVDQIEDPTKLPSPGKQGTVDSLSGSSPPPSEVADIEKKLQTLTAKFRQR